MKAGAILIERYLNDAVLGFFALLSLFLLALPYVFQLTLAQQSIISDAEIFIIALFALEYTGALALAPNKLGFISDRWRIIDALIIASAVVTLLPFVPDLLRHSPALRLLRVGRLALLGARSSLALKSGTRLDTAVLAEGGAELHVLSLEATGTRFESITWDDGLARIRNAEPDWLFITGVSESRLAPISDALGVPVSNMRGLFHSASPGFDTLDRFSTFFIRQPLPMQPGERLRRTPILMVGTAENVVVLSREQTDLDQRVEARLTTLDSNTPRIVRATLALVSEIMGAYNDVLETMEVSLSQLETAQSTLGDEAFLARAFEQRADILTVRSSLKHLKSVIRDLSSGKIIVAGANAADRAPFGFLADDASDLYEGIEDLRETLQALVDLRLNVSSFQMNRVMRLLALLTSLALIPATAGGLLGMNLGDAPWPGTLPQVAFGIGVGMSLSLYIFAIKGWLK